MPTTFTSLLGLSLPATGELAGTWGTTVNDGITSLLDSAIAGTTTLSTDADVTLTTTTGAANQARQAVLLCSGARTAARNITAPAASKTYVVINATTGGFGVVIRGVGPTTGVTIISGERALVAWNGSDFVKVSNSLGAGAATRIPFFDAGGALSSAATFVRDGSGYVGIGTASPGAQLEVSGTGLFKSGVNDFVWLLSDSGAMELCRNSGDSYIDFKNTAAEDYDVRLQAVGTSGTFAIISSGNVGVGTTAPTRKATVEIANAFDGVRVISLEGGIGAGAAAVFEGIGYRSDANTSFGTRFAGAYRRSDGTAIASGASLGMMLFGGQWGTSTTFQQANLRYAASIVGVAEGSFTSATAMPTGISFRTGSTGDDAYTPNLQYGTERMRLDQNGILMLGTSTPSGISRVYIDSTEARIQSRNSTSGANGYLGAVNPNEWRVWTTVLTDLTFGTNNAERMRLDQNGRLGIGSVSPGERLYVSAPDGSVQIGATNGTVSQRVGYCLSGVAYSGSATNHPYAFLTNDVERMRITATGNIVAGASAALATTATDGFLYVPTCAGTPTGTPTAITGMAPIVVNTTNNKLYFYSGGAWRDAGP